MASIQACEPRNLSSSPDIHWPLFFGITAEWPKITPILYNTILYVLYLTGFAILYAAT